jgi:hypothetical protein
MAGNRGTSAQLQRNFLAKDFVDLRADLLRYASTFYSDQIKDFSESGLGGMFIDLAASVGDTMSFYLDHQFNELSWTDAVELPNIERHINNAGVKITGASPSTVSLSYFIEVPAVLSNGTYVPLASALPIIQAGTVAQSTGRISFTLMDDINFGETDSNGRRPFESARQARQEIRRPLSSLAQARQLLLSAGARRSQFHQGTTRSLQSPLQAQT